MQENLSSKTFSHLILESEDNINPSYLMQGQIMPRCKVGENLLSKWNPLKLMLNLAKTFCQTLPPNEFLTLPSSIKVAAVFWTGGPSDRLHPVSQKIQFAPFQNIYSAPAGCNLCRNLFRPKVMTRIAIWQKPNLAGKHQFMVPWRIHSSWQDKTINLQEN